jgi:hypothetical protein
LIVRGLRIQCETGVMDEAWACTQGHPRLPGETTSAVPEHHAALMKVQSDPAQLVTLLLVLISHGAAS